MAELSNQRFNRESKVAICIIHYHVLSGMAYINSFRDQVLMIVEIDQYFCKAIANSLLGCGCHIGGLYLFKGQVPRNGASGRPLVNDSILAIKILGIDAQIDTNSLLQIRTSRDRIVALPDGWKNAYMLVALEKMSSRVHKFHLTDQLEPLAIFEPIPPNLAEAYEAFTNSTSNESTKNETIHWEAATGWAGVCKDENGLLVGSLKIESGVGGELSELKDEVMVKMEPMN